MAKHEMVTDEVSAVQKLGKKICLLKNEDWNFKITYPHDLDNRVTAYVRGISEQERETEPGG